MTSLPQKISDFMLEHAMLNGSRGAIVAVSGGPDSSALLDIMVNLLDPSGARNPDRAGPDHVPCTSSRFGTCPEFTLIVAHLNHKLRGQASDDDMQFVKELATRLALPAVIGVADTRTIAARLNAGIEEAARAARYSFLFRAAGLSGADRIVTGHTMNDQVETFIMRALRGSGTAGLAGMAPVRPAHQFEEIQIAMEFQGDRASAATASAGSGQQVPLLVRPALCVTREEIEQYCHERSINFRVDSSNLSGDFTRNRIRQEVISALCRIEPKAVRSIARAMDLIAIDNEALELLTTQALDWASRASGRSPWSQGTGRVFSVDWLAGQPRAILNRLIVRSLRDFLAPGNEITSIHVSAVQALIHAGRSGKHVELPGNISVWREGRYIVIDKKTDACPLSEIALTSQARSVRAGRFRITLERDLPPALYEDIIARAKSEKARTGRDWGMAVLDDSLVPDSLVIRTRRPGERARVVGQAGVNKLKNLMINHKIPVSQRAFWPLAFTRDGRYVWSPGMPPSVEFAANRETRSLASLTATDD